MWTSKPLVLYYCFLLCHNQKSKCACKVTRSLADPATPLSTSLQAGLPTWGSRRNRTCYGACCHGVPVPHHPCSVLHDQQPHSPQQQQQQQQQQCAPLCSARPKELRGAGHAAWGEEVDLELLLAFGARRHRGSNLGACSCPASLGAGVTAALGADAMPAAPA